MKKFKFFNDIHAKRAFSICFGTTLLVLLIYAFGGLDSLELKAVDFRFQLRGNRAFNPDIVIVKVDEASIEKLGRWPWPRRLHAELVQKLSGAGAKVVSFDSLFTEDDKQNPASDRALAKAANDTKVVVSAYFYKDGIDEHNIGRTPLFPYNRLMEKSSFIGFVNLEPDHDGVTRRAQLYAIDGEAAYPSLAVATYALSKGKTFGEISGELPIVIGTDPIESSNSLFINYAFSPYEPTYKTYSYVDILEGKIELEKEFKDKIVFVGATAAALFDLKAIPFIAKYPGVFIHANIVDNLYNNNYIREIGSEVTFFYVLLVGLLLGFLFPRCSPWAQMGVFAGIVGGGLLLGLWLFNVSNLVLHIVPPLVTGMASYGGILFYRLVIEEREKRKIKGSFKQYLSPKIIDVITKDPSKLKLGGEEREVTIFFLDIAGFTTMAEALKPTQLVEVMNQCLTQFSRIILRHEGLINKYIGDCIMAFWNAPADQNRHAAQACWAALECIESLPDLNRSFQEKGLPSIDCRIGINTGTVVVGNMGSNERFDYTVMGDPVNLASRLEGANKQYHTHIMVAEATFDKAKEEIEARDLDLIRVKGKKEPRKVFELLSKKGGMPEELAQGRRKYHDALHLYRQKNFEEAIHAFQEVFDYLPNDHLTRVYLERCRQFAIKPPPPQWDGVFEMKTK